MHKTGMQDNEQGWNTYMQVRGQVGKVTHADYIFAAHIEWRGLHEVIVLTPLAQVLI